MLDTVQERCNAIEECYEFTLAYAAQGLPSDVGSESGKRVREQLRRAVEALSGLKDSCEAAMKQEKGTGPEPHQAFLAVLGRDVENSIAAIEMVLAQPLISSQLIDNLNASIHLRAMLTDMFLVSEIVEIQQTRAKAAAVSS